ncbi:hypothetical protein F4782DRAFT_515394 [Xylaria castorea]|nr:hypothetical protein F4782DRAFT_515394 [Xylaria castorea]
MRFLSFGFLGFVSHLLFSFFFYYGSHHTNHGYKHPATSNISSLAPSCSSSSCYGLDHIYYTAPLSQVKNHQSPTLPTSSELGR